MGRVRSILLLGAVAVALIALGCSDDDNDNNNNVPGTELEVQMTADPEIPTNGSLVQLTASVTPTGDYTYQWSAPAGSFQQSDSPSVVWVAPDVEGTYEIQVVVHDGDKATVSTLPVVVSTYVPAVSPSYVGDKTCNTCHEGIHDSWEVSGHADALGTLVADGQDQNNACLSCHTVGFNPAVNNGGYDELRIDRLADVQCECCHGPGSVHVAGGGDPKLPKPLDSALCGTCHEGEHHPTYSEWQGSPHAGIVEEAATRGACKKCHNGIAAKDYLNDPAGYTDTSAPADTLALDCVVCHDPHGSGNLSYLRDAVNDVALPNGLHPDAGTGRLCIACHNGRRSPSNAEDQVQNGTAHFGPHPSVQGDMLAGVGAYENVSPSFDFATSHHINIQDGCVNCHNHHIPWSPGNPGYTGHGFRPIVEACQPCHGSIDSFEDIEAKADYDGDGTVEGVQDEVAGLIDTLAETIIEHAPSEEARAELQAAYDEGGALGMEEAVGNPDLTTVQMRASAYNMMFVAQDKSKGVHNATYAIQLLQQSILALNGLALDKAEILVQ